MSIYEIIQIENYLNLSLPLSPNCLLSHWVNIRLAFRGDNNWRQKTEERDRKNNVYFVQHTNTGVVVWSN